MRQLIFFSVLFQLALCSFAQNDSIYSQKDSFIAQQPSPIILKRGIYKHYSDYLANKPYDSLNFIVTYLYKSSTDSTIVGAKSNTDEMYENRKFWGFSDGTNIFRRIANAVSVIFLIYHPQDSSKAFRKGFYKDYKEFLNNSPSLTPDFTVKYFYKSKTDSTLMSAQFDSVQPPMSLGRFWGFSDGENVFIRRLLRFASSYFRLDFIGKICIFNYWQEDATALGSPVIAGLQALSPTKAPMISKLMFLTQDGEVVPASNRQLKKLFRHTPTILSSFKNEETKMTDERRKEFLILYNNTL